MGRLDGRTALVTGGSRGIGRGVVLRLAAEGAKVAFVYQSNAEAASSLVTEVAQAGGTAAGHQVDVKDKSAVDACVSKIIEDWGKIDILVNNAGIVRDTLLAKMTEQQWSEVIATNLSSVFNFCQAVTLPMMSARYGRIVNMSSVAANHGNKGQVNYAASKGGIEGFTKCMATELASRGVTVNAIAPGFIETDMTVAVRNAAEAEIKKRIPLKRLGKAEDIASAVAFLVSEEASYITGQILTVDGGLTLGGF